MSIHQIRTRIRRFRKRLNPLALDQAKRLRQIKALNRLIAGTRAEADEFERQGRPEMAARFRRFCDMHETRMKLTLIS